MSGTRSPFSPFTVLALVLAGGGMLLAMLWMVGGGLLVGEINDGGAHAGGRGLNGYAGLYRLYEAAGYQVSTARDEEGLKQGGLLVLTPPAHAKGEDIARIVAEHRIYGPVLVITPKWYAMPANSDQPGVEKGWVRLGDEEQAEWKGFLDDVGLKMVNSATASDQAGRVIALPYPDKVQVGQSERLVPWVRDEQGRVLAGQIDDSDEDEAPGTVLGMVAEPDLANNAGLAREEAAQIMLGMSRDLLAGDNRKITFDLTLNGFARQPNLLTLAFTPPFLAATLCLIMAALAAMWRAFHRFGPPLAEGRAMGFGKRALAENAAGLIRRSGRLHLLPAPYAEAARGRIVAALGLAVGAEAQVQDAAIDRALRAKAPAHEPFTVALAALRAAKKPSEILRAAQKLHAIERMLTR